MFDQINGLPVHALVIHAAVVFVPLLAVGAIVYALVPRWRPRLGWAVGLLAIISPLTTFVAQESGEKLYDRLIAQGLKGRGAEILADHMEFGETTFWFSLALGVVSLVLVAVTLRRTDRPLPTLRLRSGDGSENSDFWSALGGQLKPGLDVVVTVTLDAALRAPAGPLTETVSVRAVSKPDRTGSSTRQL